MMRHIDFNVYDLIANPPINKILFYPCCADDLIDPIVSFHEIIDTFYFCRLENYKMDAINGTLKEKLLGFELVNNTTEEQLPVNLRKIDNRGYNNQNKAAKYIDVWKNTTTGKDIKIYSVIQDGLTMLLNDPILSKIGIFFYRGDSSGEGGSGIGWLMTDRDRNESYLEFNIHHVLQHLSNNGLIVTDGSNCSNEYSFLRNCHIVDKKVYNKHFKCIGKINPRNDNQTFVWQITIE